MSLAELIRKMLTKNPEERPLMAEINYKTKSLISQYYSIDNKNIGHCPSINRVFSATTSATNFLLAARSKAAQEKIISSSRDASPKNDKSSILLHRNNSNPNLESKPLQPLQEISSQPEQYPTQQNTQTEKQNNDTSQPDPNEFENLYTAKHRDSNQTSIQSSSLSSRPPKLNKGAQLLPIIKQPTARSRSSRRSMKVSSVNLSVFTTKITQKVNINSQPNYFLARKGSAGSFDPLRNLSDSEANAEFYVQPVNDNVNNK